MGRRASKGKKPLQSFDTKLQEIPLDVLAKEVGKFLTGRERITFFTSTTKALNAETKNERDGLHAIKIVAKWNFLPNTPDNRNHNDQKFINKIEALKKIRDLAEEQGLSLSHAEASKNIIEFYLKKHKLDLQLEPDNVSVINLIHAAAEVNMLNQQYSSEENCKLWMLVADQIAVTVMAKDNDSLVKVLSLLLDDAPNVSHNQLFSNKVSLLAVIAQHVMNPASEASTPKEKKEHTELCAKCFEHMSSLLSEFIKKYNLGSLSDQNKDVLQKLFLLSHGLLTEFKDNTTLTEPNVIQAQLGMLKTLNELIDNCKKSHVTFQQDQPSTSEDRKDKFGIEQLEIAMENRRKLLSEPKLPSKKDIQIKPLTDSQGREVNSLGALAEFFASGEDKYHEIEAQKKKEMRQSRLPKLK